MTKPTIIVKTNVFPVRTLTLKELIKTCAFKELLIKPNIADSSEKQSYNSIIIDPDKLRDLWLEVFIPSLRDNIVEKLVEIPVELEGKVDAEEFLWVLGDLLSYSLRWPLYRHPIPKNVLSPHLAHAISSLLRLVFGKEFEKYEKYTLYNVLSAIASNPNKIVKNIIPHDLVEKYGEEKTVSVLVKMFDIWSFLINGGKTTGGSFNNCLELLLYTTPSDTRPGLNIPSLLLHSLTTSAFSHAILISMDKRTPLFYQAIIRIAGLLHDFGKPVEYSEHVGMIDNVVETLLGPLKKLSGFEKFSKINDIIELIKSLAKHHHSLEKCVENTSSILKEFDPRPRNRARELCNALIEGDRTSSALDRVVGLLMLSIECREKNIYQYLTELRENVKELVKWLQEEFRNRDISFENDLDVLAKAYGLKHDVKASTLWNIWSKFWEEKNELGIRLSESIRDLISFKLPSDHTLFKEITSGIAEIFRKLNIPVIGNDLSLVVIDIGGIQNTIYESQKLRSVAGSSLAIDYLTLYGTHLLIDKALREVYSNQVRVPHESMIFAGGGTIHFILPVLNDDEFIKLKNKLGEEKFQAETLGFLAIALPNIVFRLGHSNVSKQGLYAEAVAEAYEEINTSKYVPRRKYSERISIIRANKLCEHCMKRPAVLILSETGEQVCMVCGIRYRLFWHQGFSWKMRAMGITGKVIDPLEEIASFSKGRVISIVKTDGNLIGALMARSLTPTVFFEKSVRIDTALKKAIRKLYRSMEKYEEINKLIGFTYMYSGGDDALLIMPANLSLASALILVYEFGAELGFKASLSAGVAAGYYTQPIWWLLEASEELLDIGKKISRKTNVEVLKGLKNTIEKIGVISYSYSRRALSRIRIIEELETARDKNIINKLFWIGGQNGLISILCKVHGKLNQIYEKVLPENYTAPENLDADQKFSELLEKIMDSIIRKTTVEPIGEVISHLYLEAQRANTLIKGNIKSKLLLALAARDTSESKTLLELIKQYNTYSDPDPLVHELYLLSKLLGG